MDEPRSDALRRIAHLDMDAFYASVELLRYPQLKDFPLVIGGAPTAADRALRQLYADTPLADIPAEAFPRLQAYTGRGVITTANYLARVFGVGSAMGLMKAAKLCPQAILLPVDFAEYKRYSAAFKKVILEIAPVMESRGVDEVYIDFSAVPGGQRQGGRALARLLQKCIFDETGLTCSIGVAPNKLLAKMASEFHKPNGIAIVYERDFEEKFFPLPVRKIHGIGPKTEAKLHALGILTIADLAALEKSMLQQQFGEKYGMWLHEAAAGRDERPVETHSEPVSMSRETTFERDLHAQSDKAELGQIFTQLCERVAADLQRSGYVGKTIGIKIRYADFKIATRDATITVATNDAQAIRLAAGLCLKRVDLSRRFRLLGVRVGGLQKLGAVPAPADDLLL